MKVYVFGNEYVAVDKRAIEVARELEGTIEGVSFVFVTIQVLVEVILQVVLDVYLVLGRRHDHVVVLDDTSLVNLRHVVQEPRGASMTPTPVPDRTGVRMGSSSTTWMVLRRSIASSTHCRTSMAGQ
jgi:hypothetical protein